MCDTESLLWELKGLTTRHLIGSTLAACREIQKSAEWRTNVKLIKYWAFEHVSLAHQLKARLNSLYSGPSPFRH